MPPALQGHRARDRRGRGLIADQRFLFTTLAKRIGAHPAFLGFDIAVEIFWYARPFGIEPSPQQGDAWMEALLSTCEQAAPGKLHVNGVDKQPYRRPTSPNT